MIASDWVVGDLVVVGDQGALVGDTDLPVPPDGRGQGQQPLGDPDPAPGQVRPPWRSRPSWSLRVSKVLSIHWRQCPNDPCRRGSSARSGRSKTAPWAATSCSKSRPAKPLSATMTSPGRSRERSWSNSAATTSRSPSLGVARHQATGSPSGPASTYSRNPQKKRWWLLQ